jgi:FkbM family methyltransferase
MKMEDGSGPQARGLAAVAADDGLAAWQRIFCDVFAREPGPDQLSALAAMAAEPGLAPAQRYRRVLAGFDQQEFKTGFSVRWDTPDTEMVDVEGLRLHVDKADSSVSMPLARGHYENHVLTFFKGFLREGMHVVDAGANIGLYSLLAARLVGPGGHVWSFEPNSENCRLLLAGALDNGLDNLSLHPLALGNERGYTYFTSALGSNGGVLEQAKRSVMHPSCRIVPMARLDDFALPRVDLLKMDVEGAEGLVMQGARDLIARCRPVVTAEFSDDMLTRISGMSGAAFLGLFRELRYSVWLMDRATHHILPIDDTDAFAATFAGTVRIEDLLMTPEG